MKTKILLTILTLAIFASLAFAQADSCNMSIADEWTVVDTSIMTDLLCGIASYNNFVYTAIKRLVILEIESDGQLTFLDSIDINMAIDVAVLDSFLLVLGRESLYSRSSIIYIYRIRNTGLLDSFSVFMTEDLLTAITVEDTLCFGTHVGFCSIINCSDLDSLHIISTFNFPRMNASMAFTADYPYLFNGGFIWREGYPPVEDYQHGRINIMNAADPDSVFLTYEGWTQHHHSYVNCMTKRDSLLFIGSDNRYLEIYDVADDGTDIEFVRAWYPDDYEDWSTPQHIVSIDDLIITSNANIYVFNCEDPTDIETIGYYRKPPYSVPYNWDFCVQDSFIISLSFTSRNDTVRVTSFKFDPDLEDANCELHIQPENFDMHISPNPFNSNCEIRYSLKENLEAQISIYDISGRNILNEKVDYQSNFFIWNAKNEASGVYFVVLTSRDERIAKKIIYLG